MPVRLFAWLQMQVMPGKEKYTLEEMITLEIEADRGENVDGKLEGGGRDDKGSCFFVCFFGGAESWFGVWHNQ